MRIGIDIDDTITNTWIDIMPYYASYFNIPINNLKNTLPYYNSVKDRYTKEEYFNKINYIYDNIVPTVSIKKDAINILNKLHMMGNTIIIISSRGEGFTNPYSLTKKYLDDNKVYYDKLIVNANDKGKVCLKEQVDLFIDDSCKHCKEAKDNGINVLLFDNDYNKNNHEFKRISSWLDIYKYVEENR